MTTCDVCGHPTTDDPHAAYGLCGPCAHDALRAGWGPDDE